MPINEELADLFTRDLSRLLQQLAAWSDNPAIWDTTPGATNSAGNLTLHLEGNLREFVGRRLGNIEYRRTRDDEFALKGIPTPELILRIENVREIVPRIIRTLSADRLDSLFPGDPLGAAISTRQFLIHLLGHLNYHLGQIDYARRALTATGALAK